MQCRDVIARAQEYLAEELDEGARGGITDWNVEDRAGEVIGEHPHLERRKQVRAEQGWNVEDLRELDGCVPCSGLREADGCDERQDLRAVHLERSYQ